MLSIISATENDIPTTQPIITEEIPPQQQQQQQQQPDTTTPSLNQQQPSHEPIPTIEPEQEDELIIDDNNGRPFLRRQNAIPHTYRKLYENHLPEEGEQEARLREELIPITTYNKRPKRIININDDLFHSDDNNNDDDNNNNHNDQQNEEKPLKLKKRHNNEKRHQKINNHNSIPDEEVPPNIEEYNRILAKSNQKPDGMTILKNVNLHDVINDGNF